MYMNTVIFGIANGAAALFQVTLSTTYFKNVICSSNSLEILVVLVEAALVFGYRQSACLLLKF